MQAPIIVTGVPRSGTSLITCLINGSGAILPRSTSHGRATNGMRYKTFESVDIVNLTGKLFYETYKKPVREAVIEEYPSILNESFAEEVIKAVESEVGNKPWVVKDVYLPYTYPSWVYRWPDIQVIMVCRPIADILKSAENWVVTGKETTEVYIRRMQAAQMRLVVLVPENQLLMAHSNLTATRGDLSWLKTLATRKSIKPDYTLLKQLILPSNLSTQTKPTK